MTIVAALLVAHASAVTSPVAGVETVPSGSPAASPTPCTPALPGGSSVLRLDIDGMAREVIVHLPSNEPGPRLPVAVGFHGYTARATELETTSGLDPMADADGFVVAYVQGAGDPPDWTFAGHAGSGEDDLSLVGMLLDRLVADACVDPSRVVLFGHSMGGGMASAAACLLADRVAGVVLVSAFWVVLPCEPSRAVPVVAMHALDDLVLPYVGGLVSGQGPLVLGVEEALTAWADRDGCAGDPVQTAMADGSVVLEWQGCAAPVTLIRAPAGGHDWAATASERIVRLLLAR